MACTRAFLCEVCGDSFSSNWSFQRHIERRHPLAVRRITVRGSMPAIGSEGEITETGQDFEAVSEEIQRNLLALLETDENLNSFPPLSGDVQDIPSPVSVINESSASTDSPVG